MTKKELYISIIYFLLMLFPNIFYSQKEDKNINKLIILFTEKEFGRLINRASRLIESEKYRKNPLPYLYSSMGYYEMSKQPEKYDISGRDAEFKKPIVKAQKLLYKYYKKDKKKKFHKEFYPFFISLSDTVNKIAQTYYSIGKKRKALSFYKNMYKGFPEDPLLAMWQGICEIETKNLKSGKMHIKKALDIIDKNFIPNKSTASILLSGLIKVEERMSSINPELSKKAKSLIEPLKKYDPILSVKNKTAQEKLKEKQEKEKQLIIRKFSSEEENEEE